MDKNQVENLEKALNLEKTIENSQRVLNVIEGSTFEDKPQPPVRQTWKAEYPKIKTTFKEHFHYFNTIKKVLLIAYVISVVVSNVLLLNFGIGGLLELLTAVLFPFAVIIFFKENKRTKEIAVTAIRNSESYKSQCLEIDRDIASKQEQSDLNYEKELKEYEEVTLPEYELELKKWTDMINQRTMEFQSTLSSARNELTEHYQTTKIVPVQYRNIEALEFIYNTISTSDDYDIVMAIELYEKKLARDLEQKKIAEQQKANDLAELNAALLDEQNALSAEQNYIAERARRDANAAAMVGAVQRHKTNSYLKNR